MKIVIPAQIEKAAATAPEGSAILGTYSPEYGVATVTELMTEAGYLLPQGLQNPANVTRQVLAVVGKSGADHPFRVHQNGRLDWFDRSGNPVIVEPYDSGQFFKRTPFDPAIQAHLHQERVLIVGTGSVGAPMGLELAKSGVGCIIAVDKDVLEIHNCMRHVLGTAYVGWPKPVAFAHYLKEQVPTSECIPVYGDIFKGSRDSLRQVMEQTRPTRILAVTDSLKIQYLCQRAALHYQIPYMAVWCDNNAVEGEIFMWEPGQAKAWKPGRPERGCYACMRDPDKATITRSSSFDYSSDDPDSYGGEPALGTFINRINNIATIYMTAWMLRSCPVQGKLSGIMDEYYDGKGLQYIRLGGPYPFEAEGQITAKAPWGVEWYRVLKRPECPFCGNMEANESILFPEKKNKKEIPDEWGAFSEMK